MGRLSRTAAPVVAATLLLLDCAPTPGPRASPSPAAALPPTSAVPPACYVADTSAPSPDTLYIVGVGSPPDSTTADPDCAGRGVPSSGVTPVIVALEAPRGTDPRELIDGVPVPSSVGPRRADVIVSGDPGALSYAAARPSVLMAALPWATTYVLVSAHAAPAAQPPPAADRNAIARDAVTAEARGAAEPFPWLTDTACVVAGATTPSATPRAIVAYPSGDATARQLAERVVALAGRSSQLYWLEAALGAGPMPTHVAPFPADSIATALATGRAAAAIIPVARDPRRHCTTAADARVPAGAIPLVDTRAHAIVRRGSGAAFLIALDGSLYFVRQRAR